MTNNFTIDFGLLRSRYCKISYLLADIKIRVKFDNLHIYDSVCEDNSWILVANVGNVFFKFCPRLFTLFYFYLNVYYIYGFVYMTTVDT